MCGMSVANNVSQVRKIVGYCPQFDALLDLMTVREHLELYGQVRGLQGADLAEEVRRKIEVFELQAYEQTRAGQLSGGNKRKLSVAMAVVGGPRVVLLDEPSAGMDAHSRRFMWSLIRRLAEHSQNW